MRPILVVWRCILSTYTSVVISYINRRWSMSKCSDHVLALFNNFFSANYILHIQNYRNYTLLLDITFTQHTCNLSYLQSSTVVTRSNLWQYYIRHCNNIGRKWIIFKDHNRHPIPRPNGRAELWDIYCEEFGENWPRYNGTGHRTVFC